MDKIFVFAVLCLARQAATTTAASYCYDVRGSDFSLACLFENCTAAGCEGATDCGVDTTADYSTVREAQLACETAKAIPGTTSVATEFTQCQAIFTVNYVAPMLSSLGPIILGKNSNGVSVALHPGQFRVGVNVHACDADGNLEAAPRYVGESSLTDFYDQGEELSITIVVFDTRQLENAPATLDTNFAPVVASITVSPLNLKPGEEATISTIGMEVNRDDGISAMNFAVHDTAVCKNPASGDCVPVLEERNVFDDMEQKKELNWKFSLSNSMFDAYTKVDVAATPAKYEWKGRGSGSGNNRTQDRPDWEGIAAPAPDTPTPGARCGREGEPSAYPPVLVIEETFTDVTACEILCEQNAALCTAVSWCNSGAATEGAFDQTCGEFENRCWLFANSEANIAELEEFIKIEYDIRYRSAHFGSVCDGVCGIVSGTGDQQDLYSCKSLTVPAATASWCADSPLANSDYDVTDEDDPDATCELACTDWTGADCAYYGILKTIEQGQVKTKCTFWETCDNVTAWPSVELPGWKAESACMPDTVVGNYLGNSTANSSAGCMEFCKEKGARCCSTEAGLPGKTAPFKCEAYGHNMIGEKITDGAYMVHTMPNFESPYERCTGECTTTIDCAAGLECFKRRKGEPIPGCTGDGRADDAGYCYDPEAGAVHRANPSRSANGAAGQDLLGTVTVYEAQTAEAQLSGFGGVPFYLDQLATVNLGFILVTQPTVAAIVGADQSLTARAVPCAVEDTSPAGGADYYNPGCTCAANWSSTVDGVWCEDQKGCSSDCGDGDPFCRCADDSNLWTYCDLAYNSLKEAVNATAFVCPPEFPHPNPNAPEICYADEGIKTPTNLSSSYFSTGKLYTPVGLHNTQKQSRCLTGMQGNFGTCLDTPGCGGQSCDTGIYPASNPTNSTANSDVCVEGTTTCATKNLCPPESPHSVPGMPDICTAEELECGVHSGITVVLKNALSLDQALQWCVGCDGGFKPVNSAESQEFQLLKYTGTVSPLGAPYSSWTEGGKLQSGDTVVLYHPSAGQVYDCSQGATTCSQQPFPSTGTIGLNAGHWGSPYRLDKLGSNEGDDIKFGDMVSLERMSAQPNSNGDDWATGTWNQHSVAATSTSLGAQVNINGPSKNWGMRTVFVLSEAANDLPSPHCAAPTPTCLTVASFCALNSSTANPTLPGCAPFTICNASCYGHQDPGTSSCLDTAGCGGFSCDDNDPDTHNDMCVENSTACAGTPTPTGPCDSWCTLDPKSANMVGCEDQDMLCGRCYLGTPGENSCQIIESCEQQSCDDGDPMTHSDQCRYDTTANSMICVGSGKDRYGPEAAAGNITAGSTCAAGHLDSATTQAIMRLKVLDSDFTTAPERGYIEKHTLVVDGIENANLSYVSASQTHELNHTGCADLPGGCKFMECTCTPDDARPGYCTELQVEEGQTDGASTWTLRWDPWAGVNSSTAALYGTTYCHLKLRFIDNSGTLGDWPGDYVKDKLGITSETLTILLEATPGVTAAVNLPARATRFYATNTKVDLDDVDASKVTSYYVHIEDDAAGTEATLVRMDSGSYLPFEVEVAHATNLGDGDAKGLAGQECPTTSATSATVTDTECPDTVGDVTVQQTDWLFTTQTCGPALGCDLTWKLNVTTAVSLGHMIGTPGATNEVYLRLKDKGGVEVFVQMPSVRIETGRKRLARRDDGEPLRTGQFNIAVDGNGRLTASEAAPFLVVPTGESNAGNDALEPDAAANVTNGDGDRDRDGNGNGGGDQDVGTNNNPDADARDAGADSLLGNKWALIPVIAAFVALLTSIVGLVVVCSNQRSAHRARAKVHPMSAEAINLA